MLVSRCDTRAGHDVKQPWTRLVDGASSDMHAAKIWVSVLKVVFRLFTVILYAVLSFCNPARCHFPDGYEYWDVFHCAYVSYVMTRVERDHLRKRELGRLSVALQAGARMQTSRGSRFSVVSRLLPIQSTVRRSSRGNAARSTTADSPPTSAAKSTVTV